MGNAAPAFLQFTSGKSNTMNSASADQVIVTGNVPATVVGFEDEGKARVCLIQPLFGLKAGSEVVASLKFVRRGAASKPRDFEFLRKKGLRVGGVVMLLSATEHEGAVIAKRIETLKPKADIVDVRVLPDVLCSVLPPRDKSTAMVDEVILAFLGESVRVSKISAVIKDIKLALEEPCLYGPAGVIFRGPLPDGDYAYHVVQPSGKRSPGDIVGDFLRDVPSELVAAARKASMSAAWEVIPICRVTIDSERLPRLSAQYVNCDYGEDPGSLRFTSGTATLTLGLDGWVLSDASPHCSPARALDLSEAGVRKPIEDPVRRARMRR